MDNEIRITLYGFVNDRKTYLFKNKLLTMPFGVINSWSLKDRVIIFNRQEYDLKIQNNE